MCVLLLLLGLEMIYVGLIFGRDCVVWLIGAGITTFFAFAFYKAGVAGAYSWGTTVRVAFDLYRYHLLGVLYGCPPSKFFSDAKFSSEEAYSAETGIWRRISQFLQEGMDLEKREPDMSRLLNYSRIKMDVEGQKPPVQK